MAKLSPSEIIPVEIVPRQPPPPPYSILATFESQLWVHLGRAAVILTSVRT